MIGTRGLYFETKCAELKLLKFYVLKTAIHRNSACLLYYYYPDVVNTIIHVAIEWKEASTAAIANELTLFFESLLRLANLKFSNNSLWKTADSASLAICYKSITN